MSREPAIIPQPNETFFNKLSRLATDEEKFVYAKENASAITDFKALKRLISLFAAPAGAVSLVLDHRDKITTTLQVVEVIEVIKDPAIAVELVKEFLDVIVTYTNAMDQRSYRLNYKSIKAGLNLAYVLSALPLEQQQELLLVLLQNHKFFTTGTLVMVFEKWPPQKVAEFIEAHVPLFEYFTIPDLVHDVANEIKERVSDIFLRSFLEEDCPLASICNILKYFRLDAETPALKYADRISTVKALNGLVEVISSEKRTELVKRCLPKIVNTIIKEKNNNFGYHGLYPLFEDYFEFHQEILSLTKEIFPTFSDLQEFFSHLRYGPNDPRFSPKQILALAEHYIDSLTLKDLNNLFNWRDLSEPFSKEQKLAFVQGCVPAVRIAYLIQEKHWDRSLFENSYTQQLIALRRLDPNLFLFATALDSTREEDFEYFLMHPLCSVNVFNERAQSLEDVLQAKDNGLSNEVREGRLAKVRAKQEQLRQQQAQTYWGFNLTSLKKIVMHFDAPLPEVEVNTWGIEGVEPEKITRFRQLIAWLKTEAHLLDYRGEWDALENNETLRGKRGVSGEALDVEKVKHNFNRVLESLETFAAVLKEYLKGLKEPTTEKEKRQQALNIASHLGDNEELKAQLGGCIPGVISILQSMARSLNPSVNLMNAVDIAVDQALNALNQKSGVRENMEVHSSKDVVLRSLGVAEVLHYDLHRLTLSSHWMAAVVAQAAAALMPDELVRETMPSLESVALLEAKKAGAIELNPDLCSALERDWFSLYTTGLLPKAESAPDKYLAVLTFIGAQRSEIIENAIEKYGERKDCKFMLPLKSQESLLNRYRELLLEQGILTLSRTQVKEIQERIWQLLTKEGHFNAQDNNFWISLLKAPNGLAWIKATIDARPKEDWNKIQLAILLHQPKEDMPNLLTAFASNPFSLAWLRGCEIVIDLEAGADRTKPHWLIPLDIYFKEYEGPQPLHTTLSLLMSEQKERMEKELEKIFVSRGSLLFWLAELKKDTEKREHLVEAILQFLKDNKDNQLYRYDNLPEILYDMARQGDVVQKTIANSFLEERLKQQAELKLWDCYLTTACYLPDFKLQLNEHELVASLNHPLNARAAIFLAGSTAKLMAELEEASGISSEEKIRLKTVLQELDPTLIYDTGPGSEHTESKEDESPPGLRFR